MKRKKLTREQIEQMVREARERGEKPYLAWEDLRGVNLRGANLSEVNLSEANLRGVNFSEAILDGANLSQAILNGANLSQAILNGADLRGADLNGADLRGADLNRADLRGVDLRGADLREADLSWADLRGIYFPEEDLSQAVLSRADRMGSYPGSGIMLNANLSEVNLKGANLTWANLSYANLSEADLGGANLSYVNFTQTKLESANFSKAILNRTSFIEVDLSQAKGLIDVDHQGPSIIDINTIYQSKDKIPAVFLEKAGVHPDIIRWQHSLHTLPTVFICYSHKDEKEKEVLVTHLTVLKQLGTLDIWDDSQIEGGAEWEQEIIKAIARSTVAILLVSANFLSSNVINTLEIPQFLERHARDEGFVMYPIIIKPCAWDKVPWLEKIEVKPKGGKPIWGRDTDVEEELSKIASEVEGIIKDRWWKAFR